jgi:hypothetical protein
MEERVIIDRPAAMWRLQCSAWSPELREFLEFPKKELLLKWVEVTHRWATYAQIVFRDHGENAGTPVVLWRFEKGKQNDWDQAAYDQLPG